eukprot:3481352-Pyramimonas_sp.AAC.1
MIVKINHSRSLESSHSVRRLKPATRTWRTSLSPGSFNWLLAGICAQCTADARLSAASPLGRPVFEA